MKNGTGRLLMEGLLMRKETYPLRNGFLLILLLLPAWISFADTEQSGFKIKYGSDKFANVKYASSGMFNADEGTIDLLFSIAYDPHRKHNIRWYSPLYLFKIEGISDSFDILASHSYNSKLDRRWHGFKISAKCFNCRCQVDYKKNRIKPGCWHLLTFTWKRIGKNYNCKCYLDGSLLEKEDNKVDRIPYVEDSGKIIIGAKYFNGSYGNIDTFRISAVARKPEEIADAWKSGLTCDKYTLLFDNFENIKKNEKNPKRASSIPVKGSEGTIFGTFEMVAGKKGKAIKLHTVDE